MNALLDQFDNMIGVSRDEGLLRINLGKDGLIKVESEYCEMVKQLDESSFMFVKGGSQLFRYITDDQDAELVADLSDLVSQIHNYFVYPNGAIFINGATKYFVINPPCYMTD